MSTEAELDQAGLDQKQAAAALGAGISERTLEGWRVKGCGPVYHKIGRRVVYYPADLEAFKRAGRRTSTSDPGQAEHSAA